MLRSIKKKLNRKKAARKTTDPDARADPKPNRSENVGLFNLSPKPEDDATEEGQFKVDIVAIHGLNGDAYGTWSHENGTLWLRDLLPKSIPGARIFSYGYPSRVFLNRSEATIRDYAQRLLISLSSARDEDASKDEKLPIIFICHSLGGIVCKQALILAHEDDRYQDILTGTTAVLFLGTPHRGAGGTAGAAKLIGNVINVCLYVSGSYGLTGVTKTDLLDALCADSSTLKDIAMSFSKRSAALNIVTCYETETTPPIGQLVVDKGSAVMDMPHEEIIPIYANHVNLCRFDGETNQDYIEVSRALKRLARKARDKMQELSGPVPVARSIHSLSEAEKTCMILFNTSDVADYKSDLPRHVEGTCQWVLTNPQYLYWLSQRQATLLWMTGHSGCGKTTLSSYIIDYLNATQASNNSRALVCCFFCDEKIEAQRDGKAILRSVIYQILTRRNDLIKHAKVAYDRRGPHLIQSFTDLWTIFTAIASDVQPEPINIIIDAIDECEEESRNKFLDSVTNLIHEVRSMETSAYRCVKFLITSRPHVGIDHRFNGYSQNRLRIEERQHEITSDVQLVIKQKVQEIVRRNHCKPNIQKSLEQSLCARADQTFLWVTFVLHHLERSLLTSEKDFRVIVDELPRDLGAVYEQFLHSIPHDYQKIAIKLLHIIVGSLRPLTLDEINIILTIEESHGTVSAVEAEWQSNMRATIEGILGPLVRISESKVYLVHQTAKEFLQDLSTRTDHPLSAIYGVNPQKASLELARSCVSYLSLQDFGKNQFSGDQTSTMESSPISLIAGDLHGNILADPFSLEEDITFKDESVLDADACKSLADRFKFFDYSATHWASHFSSCDKIAPPKLQDAVVNLSEKGTDRFANWFRCFWVNSGMELSYPWDFDPFIVASFFGHSTIVRLLSHDGDLCDRPNASCALYWASRMGHKNIVEILVRFDIEPDSKVVDGQTPLISAAQLGHVEVAGLLIADERVDVNSRWRAGRTPLSLAAGNGHLEVVKLLLKHVYIEADIKDSSWWTPLFWAVGGAYLDVVRILATDERININHADNTGRTALSWAAAGGAVEVVRYFLADSDLKPEVKDQKGRTAISWAAEKGHLELVKLLVRSKKIDVGCKDNDGRNAISWACAAGHGNVVKFLIKHDPLGIDSDDSNGWTPLAWALNNGSTPTVKTLLATGLVDVNRKDRSGRSPLSWAAGYGQVEILRLMMAVDGADVETKDNEGRTPLSWAKINGSRDVINELQHLSR